MDDLDRDDKVERSQEDFANSDTHGTEDNFYRGLIVQLDRARAKGVIRSHSGKEVPFKFPFVAVVGAPIGGRAPGLERLRQGDEVGFDVGWTSRGLCVTVIKPRS
jgi:hypothetical protein